MAKVTFTKFDNGGMWDAPKEQEIYVDGIYLGYIEQQLGKTSSDEYLVIGYMVDLFGCEPLEDLSFHVGMPGVHDRGLSGVLRKYPAKGQARRLHTRVKNRVREIVANFEGLDEWLASERKRNAEFKRKAEAAEEANNGGR